MTAKTQIDLLANYIMAEIPGEPSQDEGAGDTAIRLLKAYRADKRNKILTPEEASTGMDRLKVK